MKLCGRIALYIIYNLCEINTIRVNRNDSVGYYLGWIICLLAYFLVEVCVLTTGQAALFTLLAMAGNHPGW